MEHPRKDKKRTGKYLFILALSAMGVVYGDIGTSVLYAVRECFHGPHAIPISSENILGVLSLIFWSLIIVVSFKYLIIILRADHKGEGGILALMEFVLPKKGSRFYPLIMILGFFGAALLYGDGVITPAISVLSAVEGLNVATSFFEPYIIPITLVILFGLFFFQKKGTAGVGIIFGPIMCVWFLTIGILGAVSFLQTPEVLQALNPVHGYNFFKLVGFESLYVLGAIFLVVTGGEALYADLGHFGTKPIRLSWFSLVLPCLLLNYFGQGALLLRDAEAAVNPFYNLCPDWMLYPMVILATIATIIASQAIISGAFSLTFQAVQLGYLPRMKIIHTSEKEAGQVYLPFLNWLMFITTAALVLGFQSSSNLAAAYGVAVSTTMVITDLLLFVAMRRNWKWALVSAVPLTLFFLIIDMGYLTANFLKIMQGGWFPLVVAGLIYFIMNTWTRGTKLVYKKLWKDPEKLGKFIESLDQIDYKRVEGIAIYLSRNLECMPPSFEQNLKHNKVLHEKIILLKIDIKNIPYVRKEKRWEVRKVTNNFYQITAEYGYFQRIIVSQLVAEISKKEEDLDIELKKVIYFLGRETLLPKRYLGMNIWQARIFNFLSINSEDASKYFQLPIAKTFEVGKRIKL